MCLDPVPQGLPLHFNFGTPLLTPKTATPLEIGVLQIRIRLDQWIRNPDPDPGKTKSAPK